MLWIYELQPLQKPHCEGKDLSIISTLNPEFLVHIRGPIHIYERTESLFDI